MRQKEDKTFINTLNNLEIGKMSKDDISIIKSRENEDEDVPMDTIRLYTENSLVDAYNKAKIDMKKSLSYTAKAKNLILAKVTSKLRNKLLTSLNNKKRTECDGLPYKVILKKDINYMITFNFDVKDMVWSMELVEI